MGNHIQKWKRIPKPKIFARVVVKFYRIHIFRASSGDYREFHHEFEFTCE